MPLNQEAINQVYNNAIGAVNGDKAAAAQLLKNAIKKFNKEKVLVHEPDLNINANMLEDLYGDAEFAPFQPIYEDDDGEEAMEEEDDAEDDGGANHPPAGGIDLAQLHAELMGGADPIPAPVQNVIDNLYVEIPPQPLNNPAWNQFMGGDGAAQYVAPAAAKPAVQYAGEGVAYKPQKAVLKDHYAFKQKMVAGNHGHDLVGYAEKADNTTKGLMVFYVNTQGLGSGAALDLLDKVKAQYKKTEAKLVASNVEVMWLPTGTGDTGAEFFSFR